MPAVYHVAVVQSRLILCNLMDCSTLDLPVPHHLPKFAQVHVHWIGDATQPPHHLTPFFLLPSIFPSIRDFSKEPSVHIRWPKYWSFSFSISRSNEYLGSISLKIDQFDLAVQGTLRSLLQHYSSKASILWCSAFLVVQFSQLYLTTGKTIALVIRIFISRVLSLLFNTLYRFVIAFPPRSNCSDFMSAVTIHSDFRAQEEEICHYVHLFLFYLPWSNGAECHDLSFFFFFNIVFKPALSHSSFTLMKRLFSSSSLSVIRVVSSAYLRLSISLPPILIQACNSSSPAFLLMCSAYRLNKQGCGRLLNSFSILNQSAVP